MNMTTEQLADALRAALETIQTVRTCAEYEAHAIVREHDSEAARDAQRAAAPSDGAWRAEDYAVSSGEVGVCIKEGDDTVLDLPFMPAWPESTQRARAARIVACVNACHGMTLEEVEYFGSPGELGRCAQLWVSDDDGEEVTP